MASTSFSSTAPPPPAASWNFSAGPGALPRPVLLRAQAELLDFAGTGHSLMELSHRSPPFEAVLARAERDLRAVLRLPDTGNQVLFMQGGATAQFSAVAYNLLGGGDAGEPPIVDYVVSGAWSQKAAEEARRLGARVHRVVDTKAAGHTGAVPPAAEWAFSGPSARYVFYCENETIHGVEFDGDAADTAFPFDVVPPGVPVVYDMSSSILS
ncbi:hypothetical protein HK405_004583 [Cladochytrium tenue]|nr:hypothetical protein HK405_004583 [Cladochytrium tenue]